ncbi:MAG: response regulator [Geminicoccaceae bacterium]
MIVPPLRLSPSRILIVADDNLIGGYLVELVQDFGHLALGPLASNARGLALLRGETPNAALLDCMLSDGVALPVAQALRAAKVPFAVLTGLDETQLSPVLAAAPRVTKPLAEAQIELMLRVLLATEGD